MAGESQVFPVDLASVGLARTDPWGFPYQYTRLRNERGQRINANAARKDRFLVPLNDDYDLFSLGKDGSTNVRITHPKSRDDVVRANNGAFIGRADRY
jgi:general secretion pathway protein G